MSIQDDIFDIQACLYGEDYNKHLDGEDVIKSAEIEAFDRLITHFSAVEAVNEYYVKTITSLNDTIKNISRLI